MAGFAEHRDELRDLDASVVAASVDSLDKAKEVADEVNFPIGHGVTRDVADALGSWWEERRQIIQPSEFVLGPGGKVAVSSYADGPLGRIEAPDVIKLINYFESR